MTPAFASFWLGLGLLVPPFGEETGPGDLESLVARLGAPRYADREEAAAALLDLGTGAIEPLRGARLDDDPEVKFRAERLLQDIERDLLLKPTLVVLDPETRKLAERARSIRAQTAFPVVVDVSDILPLASTSKPEAGPISFWDAVEGSGLDLRAGIPSRGYSRFDPMRLPSFVLTPAVPPKRPSSVDGAFRLVARRVFQEGADDLQVACELQAEPRLTIVPTSVALEILDAESEDGEPLLPALSAARAVIDGNDGGAGAPSMNVVLPVLAPDRVERGVGIARLRGRIDFEVEGRRLEPHELRLGDAGDPLPPPLDCGDLTLKVVAFERREWVGVWSLDVVADPKGWRELVMQRGVVPRRRFDGLFGDIQRILPSIELADAGGSDVGAILQRQRPQFGPDGIHLRFEGSGPPPARVRYFANFREPVSLEFDLRDIPAALGR